MRCMNIHYVYVYEGLFNNSPNKYLHVSKREGNENIARTHKVAVTRMSGSKHQKSA